jgi:hypothetical protein
MNTRIWIITTAVLAAGAPILLGAAVYIGAAIL